MTPTYSPHESEASDAFYIHQVGICVEFVALGKSPNIVRKNPIPHFHSVLEKKSLTLIDGYPKPLLAGSTSFFY